MLLRTLLLLLAVIGGYAVETPVLGSGAPPASSSVFPGGVIPTSGQVVYSNGTTLAGDSALTWVSPVLTVGANASTTAAVSLNGAAASLRGVVFYTAGVKRWDTGANTATETGSDAGSNWNLHAFTDAGAAIDTPIAVTRAAGGQITTQRPVTIGVDDAVTAGNTALLTLNHTTTGTAAALLGDRINFNIEDDGGTNRGAGTLDCQWTDASSATRTAKFVLNLTNNAVSASIIAVTPTTLTMAQTDAVTNTAPVAFTINHATSGTPAAGFGSQVQVQGYDDGATMRTMSQIVTTWTTAASASRASKMVFNVVTAAVTTTAFTIASTSATFASGFPVTISDSTASTTVGTGALIVSGGAGINGQITAQSVSVSGNLNCTQRTLSNGTVSTATTTGNVGFWRSGGTIGVAGDMVLQTDLAADANYVFRSGITTPQTVMTIGSAVAAGTTPGVITSGTSTIGAGVTDGYTTSHRFTPIYNGAFTVTRHNYIDLNQITGTSTITDACVFRFDAAAGTHKALNAGTTKTTPGTVNAWLVMNVNGTLYYVPAYTSKTSMVSPIERAVRATISLPTQPCERVSYERATEAA